MTAPRRTTCLENQVGGGYLWSQKPYLEAFGKCIAPISNWRLSRKEMTGSPMSRLSFLAPEEGLKMKAHEKALRLLYP